MGRKMGEIAIAIDREAVAAACRRYGVRRLDLFGSIVTEAFDEERSDVDVLVRFDEGMARSWFEDYFGLLDALEEIFHRKVDLVSEGRMRNPYFKASVDRQRQQVFP